MRLALTSSTDRRLFNLLTSSLPNGLRLKLSVPVCVRSFTFQESAPMWLTIKVHPKARRRRTGGPSRLRRCTFRPPGSDVRTGRCVSHDHPQASPPASDLSDVRPWPDQIAAGLCGGCCGGDWSDHAASEAPSTIFEFGGPRVYSYEEFLGAVAHQAGLAPRLIPIPFAVWHALAWASEMFPSPLLTRNQVELMQIDTVSSPEMPGFVELGISPHSVEALLERMLSNCG